MLGRMSVLDAGQHRAEHSSNRAREFNLVPARLTTVIPPSIHLRGGKR